MRTAAPEDAVQPKRGRVRFFYGIAPYASTDLIESCRTSA